MIEPSGHMDERRASPSGGTESGDAFVGSLARYGERLLQNIRRMMGPEVRQGMESSDVLQSVYAEAVRGLREGSLVGEKLLPWMTEVARHKIVDEVRRRREDPLEVIAAEPLSSGCSPASAIADGEDARALLEALGELEPERRRVVRLRCENGWSWARIGEVSGRSEEAVRKLYHRSLLELGLALARRKVGDPGSPDEHFHRPA